MRSRKWFLVLLPVLVAVVIYALSVFRSRAPASADAYRYRRYEPEMQATNEGPPVIVLGELKKRGLDEKNAEMIEPHFHVLNAALVTLVELQRAYDAASKAQQNPINAEAIPFHITADLHQRSIIGLLPMPQETIFDNYVQERKRIVGLHDWHPDHIGATRPGGLVAPQGTRH